jgi:hypothetical protein
MPHSFVTTSVCREVSRIQDLSNLILGPSDGEGDHKLTRGNDSEGFSHALFIRL